MSAKTFTTADLAAHSSKNSLYLAVGGKVYDCTDFIDEVPYLNFTAQLFSLFFLI
jgi:cytochrome b involved in lipid metabolism